MREITCVNVSLIYHKRSLPKVFQERKAEQISCIPILGVSEFSFTSLDLNFLRVPCLLYVGRAKKIHWEEFCKYNTLKVCTNAFNWDSLPVKFPLVPQPWSCHLNSLVHICKLGWKNTGLNHATQRFWKERFNKTKER